METKRLRQFCTVAETLNLRKASEILNISHGGLFKSLKVLEEDLGYSLFCRQGRGLILTAKGKAFYPKALKFLEQFKTLIGTPQKMTESIRIGTFEVFSTYFFSSQIVNEFPTSDILIQELVPGEMEKALINETIDIAITYEPIPLQGLNIFKVGQLPMGIFGLGKKYSQHSFEALPFAAPALPIDSPISSSKGLDGWPEHKFPRNIKYRVSMMESALQLCAHGHAVGFFPKPLITLFNRQRKPSYNLSEIASPKKYKSRSQQVYIVLRASSSKALVDEKIISKLRTYCEFS